MRVLPAGVGDMAPRLPVLKSYSGFISVNTPSSIVCVRVWLQSVGLIEFTVYFPYIQNDIRFYSINSLNSFKLVPRFV